MTEKYIEAIASILRATPDPENESEVEVVKNIAENVGAMLLHENPNFNIDKFLTACGF